MKNFKLLALLVLLVGTRPRLTPKQHLGVTKALSTVEPITLHAKH